MKNTILLFLILLALFVTAMSVISAIFDSDYWRAVVSLVALALLSMALYPRVMQTDPRRQK